MPVTQGQMAPGMMPPGQPMPGAMPPPGMAGPTGGMGQLDPATVEAMLALQSQQGRRSSMDRQLALADQLRADAGDQLKGKRTGLANVGASVLNTYAAKKQMEDAEAKGGKLDEERMGASRKFLADLMRQQGGGGMGGGGALGGFGGLM